MPPSRDSFRRNRVAPIDGSILALLPSDYGPRLGRRLSSTAGNRGCSGHNNWLDQLYGLRHEFFRRCAIGAMYPLFYGSVDGPARGGRDHLWRNAAFHRVMTKAIQQHQANLIDYG